MSTDLGGTSRDSASTPAQQLRRQRGWNTRLARQGITPAQLGFQILIVTIGVYIAIVLQDQADQRSRAQAAAQALATIELELAEDQQTIAQILEVQKRLVLTYRNLATVVRSNAQDTVLQRLLGPDLPRNLTFFSRRAAYSALVSGGHFEFIADSGLRLRLAQVYEHDYIRLDRNGVLCDEIFQDVFRRAALNYWDYERKRPVAAEAGAAIQLANASHRMSEFSEYYQDLLRAELGAIEELRTRIAIYRKSH